MKIQDLDLGDRPLFLAPMEDVTDPSFRHLCKRFGADMMFTEFVNSDGLIRDAESCQRKLNILENERPIGIQLYGHIIESMVEACKIATEAKPDVIDINFGCPVKKIANRGAGSGMLKDTPKLVEMTRQIVNATHIPVTVKTRLGWDNESKQIVELAERLQDVGIKALTIHGRTRTQLYKGEADWSLIGEVKANARMHIPIIGNGDIDNPEKAVEHFNRYGVDGIMIGRATYGSPWIFKEIKHYMHHGERMQPLTVEQKVSIAKEHLLKSIEFKGERRGILELRRHLTCYFKGLPNFKEIRLKLVTTDCPHKLDGLLSLVAQRYAGFVQDENINPSPWV
ncbi:MAG TPA: tRNA dihydrouridine synthase DusB [Perlabentimonas sp.]|nr:tRNA dihydrouridine synthase DusB [Bacteroidales bacterium]MDD4671344.1 tRNA dihydrouridine synthase DusB [Bacteroidales bacterium]MDY0349564.1 tRNA dihydrouridine synthase DusB [Tenuifilaceae bacterium]HZJ74636.1 tRNA dihydrouridine synthase DusB [Perlabentimonas sp.]